MDWISVDELAELSGASAGFVRELTELHVLEPGPNGYAPRDIARVRAAEAWADAGMEPTMLHDLIERGRYTMAWIDATYPNPVPLTSVTGREAIAELGLPASTMERLFTLALQLPAPRLDDRLREDELAFLRAFALSAQLTPGSDDELIANTRFFGENLRRLAESQVEAFRQVVMTPLLSGSSSVFEAIDAAVPIAQGMLEIAEQTVALLHRRQVEQHGTEIIVENMELLLEEEGLRPRRPGRDPSIAFLDLSDSTYITDLRGDTAALEIADGLSELAAVAAAGGGRTVKFLGDGMMLHFADPAAAVPVSLDLVAIAPDLRLPPARVGVSTGPALHRDGDYFGRTVIVAARLNGIAGPGEVLVSDTTAAQTPGSTFEALGPRSLKGIAEAVPVFRATRS